MNIIKKTFPVYDTDVFLLTIKFENLIYLWIGDNNHICDDLQCAFPLNNIKDEFFTGSTLIGQLDSISQDLSKILARKYGYGIFMSINIQQCDYEFLSKFQEDLVKIIYEIYDNTLQSSLCV